MLLNRQMRYWIGGAILLIISVPLVAYAVTSSAQTNNVKTNDVETKTNSIIVSQSESVQDIIKRYSLEYSVPVSLTLIIAKCESGFNPSSHNLHSTATGIYQFLNSTWISTREQMGLDSSLSLRLNAEENIKTGVWKIAHGGLAAWNSSKGCWGNYATASNITTK